MFHDLNAHHSFTTTMLQDSDNEQEMEMERCPFIWRLARFFFGGTPPAKEDDEESPKPTDAENYEKSVKQRLLDISDLRIVRLSFRLHQRLNQLELEWNEGAFANNSLQSEIRTLRNELEEERVTRARLHHEIYGDSNARIELADPMTMFLVRRVEREAREQDVILDVQSGSDHSWTTSVPMRCRRVATDVAQFVD